MKRTCLLVATALLVACAGDDTTTSTTGSVDESAPTTVVTEQADETDTEPRTITVGGMGAEYAPPVRSVVNLGVSVRRPTVDEASRAAAAAAEAVTAAVEAAGIPPADIQTSDFRIEPTYDSYPNIVGYTVSIGYNVTFADVDDVGAVLGWAIAAGGDDVRAYGVRFEPDPAALMDRAREEAWADARARAEATAELTGESLGQVLDAHEKVLITSPQGMVQGGEGDSASFDIPVSPGSAGVTVLLTVTYEIGS